MVKSQESDSNHTRWIIELLLVIALILSLFIPTGPAQGDNCPFEFSMPSCDDGNRLNGYWWRDETWVPGFITIESHFQPMPRFTKGWATYYSPGTMEATARFMDLSLDGYLDGVALMGCSEIGATVWVRRWKDTKLLIWEGPFLVVDCAEWDDHYAIAVGRWEVIEVGFKTAVKWGMAEKTWRGVINNSWMWNGVEVWIGENKPPEWVADPISYPEWFWNVVDYIPEWHWWLPYKPVFFNDPVRWYCGDAVGFVNHLDNRDSESYDRSWWYRYYREHLYKEE